MWDVLLQECCDHDHSACKDASCWLILSAPVVPHKPGNNFLPRAASGGHQLRLCSQKIARHSCCRCLCAITTLSLGLVLRLASLGFGFGFWLRGFLHTVFLHVVRLLDLLHFFVRSVFAGCIDNLARNEALLDIDGSGIDRSFCRVYDHEAT